MIYELNNGNGFIKDYNSVGKLLFEGEYLDGDKNGKGKQYYYNGRLKFKGQYLNGKKWNGKINNYSILGKRSTYELIDGKGYIKENNYECTKIFEGGYIYGLRNGKGKEYYSKGELIFEGEYSNDKKINGKMYYKSH